MMRSLLLFAFRWFFSFLVWLFLFSLRWDGQTLFDRAHETLVDNELVSSVETELSHLADVALEKLRERYAQLSGGQEKRDHAVY